MASNKAGGNAKKIGRNKDKPWKKRYDSLSSRERNKRQNGETAERRKKHCRARWARRIAAGKPRRGYRRASIRIAPQKTVASHKEVSIA